MKVQVREKLQSEGQTLNDEVTLQLMAVSMAVCSLWSFWGLQEWRESGWHCWR